MILFFIFYFFVFERFGRMHENKTFYFMFFVWMKIKYLKPDLYLYSIKIQTNINQNAVKYLQKITDFEKNFSNSFFIFGLSPTRPMWLGWTQPPVRHWPKPVTQTNHARVKLYACMEECEGNYITFALFMLVFADSKNEPLCKVQKDSCSFLCFLSVSVF